MRGCTSLGKRLERKRAQCEVQRQQAVDVWRGECGEYGKERSGTAAQGGVGMEDARGRFGGSAIKDGARGARGAHVPDGCGLPVSRVACTEGKAK